jgi:hypothetical protein
MPSGWWAFVHVVDTRLEALNRRGVYPASISLAGELRAAGYLIQKYLILLKDLARPEGFEPPTLRSEVLNKVRSIP